MEEPGDEALMARIGSGDRTAYAVLVRRYSLRYRALAYRFMGDMEQAEDIVQEAFIKLWTHAASFDADRARFTTWFHRIVVNRCLDEKRRVRPVALPEGYDAEDPSAGAEAQLAESDDQASIKAALADLPERQRTAVTLSYFDDMSNQEAADVMELKLKAYESLLVRARANMRQRLTADKDRLFAVVE